MTIARVGLPVVISSFSPLNASLPPGGSTRSSFDINYRDQYSTNWNINLQRQLGRDYMVELAYVGSAGRQQTSKTDLNQARNIVGVTNADVNRPFIRQSPALRTVSTAQSLGQVPSACQRRSRL